MSADTGMNDKQKLKAQARLRALAKSTADLIDQDARSDEDVRLVLSALQAFKDGTLVAVATTDREQVEGVQLAKTRTEELILQRTLKRQRDLCAGIEAAGGPEPFFQQALERLLEDYELSIRTIGILQLAGIHTVRQLVGYTEAQMLKMKNCGRKSTRELREGVLNPLGLHFGMTDADIGAWLRRHIDASPTATE